MTTTTTPTAGATTDQAIKATIEALVAVPQPESAMASYTALDRSGRARVRTAIESRSKATLAKATDLDGLAEAKRLMALLESLKSTKSTPSPAVDPVEVIAGRIATLRLAADLLAEGLVSPEGMESYAFDDEALRDIVTGVSYSQAVDLATAKATRNSPTHKVEDAMAAAFADKKIGDFMTVNEIAKAWVAAGGPEKSNGRISARLFAESGCTLDHVEPVEATATTPKGARLVKSY